MIKAELYYRVKDKTSFEKKVFPYIYGLGQYYPEIVTKIKWIGDKKVKATINSKSVSQLVDAAVGMLRFSPDSFLEDIEVKEFNRAKRGLKVFQNNKTIIGAILKPALANLKKHQKIIEKASKLDFKFVKDDDVVEFSANRVKNLYKFCDRKITYFHKVNNQKQFSNRPTMIIPWVDGWSLAEAFNKKAPLIIHCANTPLQISWKAHIILSRLAGADFIVVPDEKFDKSANFKEMIGAVSRKIKGLPSARIIIAGAMTQKRIEEIKKLVNRKLHRHIGFAIGSWLIKKMNPATEFLKPREQKAQKRGGFKKKIILDPVRSSDI